MPLVYGQDERVTRWVAEQLGFAQLPSACASIGYEVDGVLQAGVMFDNMTETNVFAHIVSIAPALPISLVTAVGRYAFDQIGAQRITFMVADNNAKCLRLVRALGAVFEARLARGHAKGDVLIFVVWNTAPLYRRLTRRLEVTA